MQKTCNQYKMCMFSTELPFCIQPLLVVGKVRIKHFAFSFIRAPCFFLFLLSFLPFVAQQVLDRRTTCCRRYCWAFFVNSSRVAKGVGGTTNFVESSLLWSRNVGTSVGGGRRNWKPFPKPGPDDKKTDDRGAKRGPGTEVAALISTSVRLTERNYWEGGSIEEVFPHLRGPSSSSPLENEWAKCQDTVNQTRLSFVRSFPRCEKKKENPFNLSLSTLFLLSKKWHH